MIPIDEPPLTAGLIADRHRALLARLRGAAAAAGRDPEALRLVAVTKGFDANVVRAALAAGLTRFGENRVQEAISKMGAAPDAEWHLVGHLQGNKARAAARAFSTIHSIDSIELLQRLDRVAVEEGLRPALLLQVNVTGEATKAGFPASWFQDQLRGRGALSTALEAMTGVQVVGLMTIGPTGAPIPEAREAFSRLRRLRDDLEQLLGRRFPELSMGMTADAEAAAAEGATLVRVGTALFGPRPA